MSTPLEYEFEFEAFNPKGIDPYAIHSKLAISGYVKATEVPVSETNGVSHSPQDLPSPKVTLPGLTSDSINGDKPVCIIGAGMAGLYTAMILESLDIPFVILEARNRVGGRMFTHRFRGNDDYEYYDVGAMRFPDTKFMARTFDLVKMLNKLQPGAVRLIPYRFVDQDNPDHPPKTPNYFNGLRMPRNSPPVNLKDPYNIIDPDGANPKYIPSPWQGFANPSAINDYLHSPEYGLLHYLKSEFYRNRDDLGLAMKLTIEQFDQWSMRTYLSEANNLPSQVINLFETFDKSTGWYDRALMETICEDLAFNWLGKADDLHWFCFDGGSSRLPEAMESYLKRKQPSFEIRKNTRVTAIADPSFLSKEPPSGLNVQYTNSTGTHTQKFGAVVCTIPLSTIGFLDLSQSGINKNYAQWSGLRELQYGPAIKIGIRFEKNWWYPLSGIVGGQSFTDLPIRTIVYPSYPETKPEEGGKKSNVLIVSYCWTQDAERLGSFIDNETGALRAPGLDIVLRNLREVHGLEDDFDFGPLETFAYDWLRDPLNMGGYAFFGPQQFKDPIWLQMRQPACNGQLYFAGEASSACHAWVAGALDSAWMSAMSILKVYDYPPDIIKKFLDKWGNNEYLDHDDKGYKDLDAYIKLGLWQSGVRQAGN